MAPLVSVKCSGALYSSLIFELMKNSKVQEGFLLGDIKEVISHSISDLEIRNENASIIINVSSFVPCSSLSSFYSGSGDVKPELLKACIGNDWEKLVGWYRYRGSCEEIYLRELRIHRQLNNIMPHVGGNFILAIISSIKPADAGTLDIDYKFHIMQNNHELEGSPLEIVNMTDTSTSHFIKEAHSSSLYDCNGLKTILGNILNTEPGVSEAEQLHSGLVNRLREILPKYSIIQEKHHKMMLEMSKLQAFCHSAGLISDYIPGAPHKYNAENVTKSPKLQTRFRKLLKNGESNQCLEDISQPENKTISSNLENANMVKAKECTTDIENNDLGFKEKSVTTVTKDKTLKKANRTQSSPRIESPKSKPMKGRVRRSSSSCSPVKVDKDYRTKGKNESAKQIIASREIKLEVHEKMSVRNSRKCSPTSANKVLRPKNEIGVRLGSGSPEY